MFCRFCGAEILPDSRYCSRCGKRLLSGTSPRLEAIGRKLRLRTPYPYAGVLCVLILVFVLFAERSRVDYSELHLTLELIDEASLPEEGVFRHRLSLVVENLGADPVRNVPVGFRARVQPAQSVDVVTEFAGRQLVVLEDGEAIPLVLLLADEVQPAEKRRYGIDGIVTAPSPAEVTYEVLAEDTEDLLASLSAQVRPAPRTGF